MKIENLTFFYKAIIRMAFLLRGLTFLQGAIGSYHGITDNTASFLYHKCQNAALQSLYQFNSIHSLFFLLSRTRHPWNIFTSEPRLPHHPFKMYLHVKKKDDP